MIVLVGERANRHADGGDWTIDRALREGAFVRGPARGRLHNLGLRWDMSLNILSPLPTLTAEWTGPERARARQVGDELLQRAASLRDVAIVSVGSRPAWALRINDRPLTAHTIRVVSRATGDERSEPALVNIPVYLIPHPSGVNRWWNDPENVEAARRFIRTIMRRHGQSSKERMATCAR